MNLMDAKDESRIFNLCYRTRRGTSLGADDIAFMHKMITEYYDHYVLIRESANAKAREDLLKMIEVF